MSTREFGKELLLHNNGILTFFILCCKEGLFYGIHRHLLSCPEAECGGTLIQDELGLLDRLPAVAVYHGTLNSSGKLLCGEAEARGKRCEC